MSKQNNLRVYEPDTPQYRFYKEQHAKQTYEYVVSKTREYSSYEVMTIKKALAMMDNFIDPSDPDVSSENSVHAYQTAERIRKEHPYDEELQVCGLIHDLGKVLFYFGEPSWSVVGDTYAVGCAFPESIVYYETIKDNPDYKHPVYSTKYGIYAPRCGIENLNLSFGHDEYLYKVLQTNQHQHGLSAKYQNIIRFHSFYPWHTGMDSVHFEQVTDEQLKQDVLEFNKYDLYSKQDSDFILTDDIRYYYGTLLDKYFPEPINWLCR